MKRLLLLLFTYFSLANAASSVDEHSVSSNINDLKNQIQKINQDLNNKQHQQKKINAALQDSQSAVNHSRQLLQKLQTQRDVDVKQIHELSATIPELANATQKAKDQVRKSVTKIYQQIQEIENDKNIIFAGNDAIDVDRKKNYLLKILRQQEDSYKKLNQKLINLEELNSKLQAEVDSLNNKLGKTQKQHLQLLHAQDETLQKSTEVKHEIVKEKAKLNNLKKQQIQLNNLLNKLARQEKQEQLARVAALKNSAKSQSSQSTSTDKNKPLSHTNPPIIDNSVEDNSSFTSRALAKPVSGKISVGFGQMRDNVRNNGVLLSVDDNTPVYSISNGVVLFSGELPGFGQIIVIDNGNNYTSVYSGILSSVAKGVRISKGQQIANSGVSENQPMGGIYFELRHLGKPVNPSKVFN